MATRRSGRTNMNKLKSNRRPQPPHPTGAFKSSPDKTRFKRSKSRKT